MHFFHLTKLSSNIIDIWHHTTAPDSAYLTAFALSLQYSTPPHRRPQTRALPLLISLQVRYQLSTSFRCASHISTACNAAAGALPALYIVPTHVSHFNRYLSHYRCITSSLPRSDMRLPFQPLVMWLQVRCWLSTSFQRASPISTACNTATGALPALYLVPTCVSQFNRLQYGYRCVASSLHHSDAQLPF